MANDARMTLSRMLTATGDALPEQTLLGDALEADSAHVAAMKNSKAILDTVKAEIARLSAGAGAGAQDETDD